MPFVARVRPDSSYNQNLQGIRKYLEGARYLLTRRGILALGSSAVSAYVRSSAEQPQPDLQLAIRPVSATFHPDGSVAVDREPGVGGAVVLVRPNSVGHLHLTSPDPLKPPAFHPNYLSDQSDVERTIHGLRLLRRVLAAEPIARRIVAEVAPGPTATTDEQLLDHSKRNGNTAWHQTGTCKMGSDAMAVVDAKAPRPRHRPAARGRRLDHAADHERQHQRAHDHDRREGGGHDPAESRSAAAGNVQ